MPAQIHHALLQSYGRQPVATTFLGNTSSTANQATYSFASCDLGTASPNRIIVVACWCNGSAGTLSSGTINGVTAEVVATVGAVGFLYATVPTGTSGTIAFTFSAAGARGGIGWWGLTNAQFAPYDFAVDSGDTTPSPTLDVYAGGVIIATANGNNATAGTITGVTEQYDARIEADSVMIGGHLLYTVPTLNQAVNFSFTGATVAQGAAVSFKPGP